VNISGEHPHYHTFTLFSIINNLVTNAVEAILVEGSIELSVERNDDSVVLNVCDNGCGISVKNKPFIFEPGFTTKFDQTGVASNGIGLSYIKNIIEGIGGEIKLLDSVMKKKTTFKLVLPITALTERG
jgi:two-component system sensor histidine kinase YcbA